MESALIHRMLVAVDSEKFNEKKNLRHDEKSASMI